MLLLYEEILEAKESKVPVSIKPKVQQLASLCLMNFYHLPDDKMLRRQTKNVKTTF